MTEVLTSYVLIIRAATADPASDQYVQLRLGLANEPDPADTARLVAEVRKTYTRAFGEEPERVGSAVLPWIDAEDDLDD